MKKIFLISFLAVVPITVGAQTDDKTVQFLKKLNLYFYCPSREGLKGFTCDITVTTSPVYKQNLLDLGADQKLMDAIDGQKLTLTVKADGKYTIGVPAPPSSGDTRFDAQVLEQVNNFKKNLQPVIDTWVSNVFLPFFNEDSYKNTCTVKNNANGFNVEEVNRNDSSVLELEFDTKAKLGKVTASKNGMILLTLVNSYSRQEKGYQLDAYTGDVPKMNVKEADNITYGDFDGFTLPLKVVKQFEMPPMFKKGTELTYTFSHYQFGLRPSGTSPVEGI